MVERTYPSYYIYKDAIGEYRWRYEKNGNIIADSGQGYANKANCKRGIAIMKASADSDIWRASEVESD